MTIETAMARAERGARWLDTVRPGWDAPGRIDLPSLRLEDCVRCALGQIFGLYSLGVDVAFEQGATIPWAKAYDWARYCGFTLYRPESDEAPTDWEMLREAWVALIETRRALRAWPAPVADAVTV